MADIMKESNHMIVWLDRNIASPDCCKVLRKAFSTATNPENKIFTNIDDLDIENLIRENSDLNDSTFLQVPLYFKLFSDIEPCRQFLIENAGRKRVFFITSGSLGEHIVPELLTDHRKVFEDENGKLYEDSIYIFCADMIKHGQWAIEYLDLDCIKMENDDQAILARLTRDIAKYFLEQGKQLSIDKNHVHSLNKALKYFNWSRTLFHNAQSIAKTHTSQAFIHDIDQLIEQTKNEINQLENRDDQEKFGEEN